MYIIEYPSNVIIYWQKLVQFPDEENDMNQRGFLKIICIAISLLLLVACGKTVTQVPPTPVDEKYEQVDTSALKLDFQAEFTGGVRTDSDGNVTEFGGGTITKFTIDGKPIELTSQQLSYEDNQVYILTKEFGKFKLSFNPDFSMGLALKPSQKAALEALLN